MLAIAKRLQSMNEFTIHLVSSISMSIFPENNMVNIDNFFSEDIRLEGDWRLVLTEIILPCRINQVKSKFHQNRIPSGAVSKLN